MLKVIEAKGDYYECGIAFGKECRESIAYRLEHLLPAQLVVEHRSALEQVDATCREFCPDIVRELEGIAEGSGADYWRLLLLNTPEITERASGCTSIAVVQKDQVGLFHNEDGNSDERSEDCVLLHYELPHISFYGFSYAGEIVGGSYNWNSYGLYFSVNYLKPINPDITGRVSRNFVARKLIEAKSIDEAIVMLRSSHDASGYHYYMGQGERLVSVENFRDEVSVKEISGINVHANHYLHPQFAGKETHSEHSDARQKRAVELAEEMDPLQILADRQNSPLSICTLTGEALHTISTFGAFPREGKVVLYEPETLKEVAIFTLAK